MTPPHCMELAVRVYFGGGGVSCTLCKLITYTVVLLAGQSSAVATFPLALSQLNTTATLFNM